MHQYGVKRTSSYSSLMLSRELRHLVNYKIIKKKHKALKKILYLL